MVLLCFFCVLYGFAVGFVIFFTALVLRSCGSYGFVLWFVFVACVLFLCVFVWWIVVALFGTAYDVYIICGFGFDLVGWPGLAVCARLI